MYSETLREVERKGRPHLIAIVPEGMLRERRAAAREAILAQYPDAIVTVGDVDAVEFHFAAALDQRFVTASDETLAAWVRAFKVHFYLNVVEIILLAVILVFMTACSREQPIARQPAANQQPNSSSADAFTATDADLDRAEIARQMEETTKAIEAQTVEARKVTADLDRINKRTQAAIDRMEITATDTAQPLRHADTRTAHFDNPAKPEPFAGVAMARRAGLLVPTVVQLATNVSSLTAYMNGGAEPRRVDEVFRRGYAFIRIPEPGRAVRFEVIRGAVGHTAITPAALDKCRGLYSRTFHQATFLVPVGAATTLPVQIDGPIQNVRIIVIGMDASGVETFMLPDTRLIDLPRWVEP